MRDKSKIMPCKEIILESQTFSIGKRTMLSITDAHGHRSAHQMTAAPVVKIELYENGDIQELTTELGTYSGVQKVNNFKHDNKPIGIVRYYNRDDGGVKGDVSYMMAIHMMSELRKYYMENGNHDIQVFLNADDNLTHQRVINTCMVYAGERPNITDI